MAANYTGFEVISAQLLAGIPPVTAPQLLKQSFLNLNLTMSPSLRNLHYHLQDPA